MTGPAGGVQPEAAEREIERIRSVYRVRDANVHHGGASMAAARLLQAERWAATARLLEEFDPSGTGRLIDVGCGVGSDLRHWREQGMPASRLAGIDLIPERLAVARERCPGVTISLATGTDIPFEDGAFDFATAATVFSSILDPEVRRNLFAEMTRVVRRGGWIVVYDFQVRKPWNKDVTAITPGRMSALAGRPPDRSMRLSPLLPLVRLGCLLHPRLGRLAARTAPRTHFLAAWRVPDDD